MPARTSCRTGRSARDVFKRMVTGEPVPARDLYKSATDFRPTALHVFSTNVLARLPGRGRRRVVRRLMPVGFNRVVPEAGRDPDLARKIMEQEADLLLEMAVEGASRLIKNPTSPCRKLGELLTRWTLSADPVRAWAAERLEVTAEETGSRSPRSTTTSCSGRRRTGLRPSSCPTRSRSASG